MNIIKAENYILIQGWMVTNLKLKGNDLLIYAIIYGFSQDNKSKFEGSASYLAEWTNSTKRGIYKSLKNLIEKDYIEKEEIIKNGIKLINYKIKNQSGEQSSLGVVNKVHWGGEQSSQHNIDNNIDNNNILCSNPICSTINNNSIYLLRLLNEKSGYKYKEINTNLNLIQKRLKDYSFEELSEMIKYICNKWKNDSKMKTYLRPSTLFRPSNCENYVAESKNNKMYIENEINENISEDLKQLVEIKYKRMLECYNGNEELMKNNGHTRKNILNDIKTLIDIGENPWKNIKK